MELLAFSLVVQDRAAVGITCASFKSFIGMPIVLVMVDLYEEMDQLGRNLCSRFAYVAESLRARMSNLIGLRFREFLAPSFGSLSQSFSFLPVSELQMYIKCNELVSDIMLFQTPGESLYRSASCYCEHFQRYPCRDL